MRIYYLHHSAVCVVLEKALLIFDYYLHAPGKRINDGYIGAEDIKEAERVYVFVSHAHHDHYSRGIYEWAHMGVPVTYILDDTVPAADAPEGAVFLTRGETYDDGYVHVCEYGSTDIGGSFYVEGEGIQFFHAGDLNDWHWKDDGNERYSRVMKMYFERELRFLRHGVKNIDYAFFPVDKRMGSGFDEGADLFIETMKPGALIPIHFVDFEDTAVYSKKQANGNTKVLTVHRKGEQLV